MHKVSPPALKSTLPERNRQSQVDHWLEVSLLSDNELLTLKPIMRLPLHNSPLLIRAVGNIALTERDHFCSCFKSLAGYLDVSQKEPPLLWQQRAPVQSLVLRPWKGQTFPASRPHLKMERHCHLGDFRGLHNELWDGPQSLDQRAGGNWFSMTAWE